MYGYIYKWTNLINNKIYIGKHASAVLDKKYIGSGKYFRNALHKYGLDSFVFELIEECNNLEELNESEKFWIASYNSTDPLIGYNISRGGDGGDTFSSKAESEKLAFRIRMSKITSGSIMLNKDGRLKRAYSQEMIDEYVANGWEIGGLPRSNDVRKLMSEKMSGMKFFTNGQINLRLNPDVDQIPENFYLGMTKTAAQYAYMEKCAENRAEKLKAIEEEWLLEDHYCETCGIKLVQKYGNGRFCSKKCSCTHNHSEETKQLLKFYNLIGICGNKGKKHSTDHKQRISEANKKHYQTHRYIWVTNGIEAHRILEEEFENYAKAGYAKGRKVLGKEFKAWNKGLDLSDERVLKNSNNRKLTMLERYGSLNPYKKKEII